MRTTSQNIVSGKGNRYSKWNLEVNTNSSGNLMSETATFLRMSAERLNKQMSSDLAIEDPASKLQNAYNVLN
jgi:hypothetical protein